MKSSNIGGQALIEGIMMRHMNEYSVAVRTPDNQIVVKKEPCRSITSSRILKKIPVVRGVISFIDSLVIGIRALFYSASFVEDDEEETAGKDREKEKESGISEEKKKKKEEAEMTGVFLFSFAVAILLFVLLPYYISVLLGKIIPGRILITLIEAVLRVAIFLGYLFWMTKMKDVNRTFMYHGAEHKCINCIEHGKPLTVENVMQSSRFHKRCGTSFLVIVVILSAVLLMFVQTDSRVLRVVWRLLLIPVIAGISFELLQFTGRHEGKIVDLLSAPGLATQRLTTSEPDESMAEVAIAAVEAVFDWRAYLKENGGGNPA
ncbi:MAG: DUF1385 domain-containing protein [Bilifractor sp.]|jgi:uncharacterized protein YqhQ